MNEDWSQPDFYRFNQDSLALVNWIQQQNVKADAILDLGCGCGIIGIELARRLSPKKLTLLELQSEFLPHIQSNLKQFCPSGVSVEVRHSSFLEFTTAEKFDLIVSNPPYYLPGHGQAAGNPQRARCRSFVVDGWEVFLMLAKAHLQKDGKLVLIIPQDRVLMDHIASVVPTVELQLVQYDWGKNLILELTAA